MRMMLVRFVPFDSNRLHWSWLWQHWLTSPSVGDEFAIRNCVRTRLRLAGILLIMCRTILYSIRRQEFVSIMHLSSSNLHPIEFVRLKVEDLLDTKNRCNEQMEKSHSSGRWRRHTGGISPIPSQTMEWIFLKSIEIDSKANSVFYRRSTKCI